MNKICIVYTHSKVGDLIWQLPYIESISEYHNQKITFITREETHAKSIMADLEYIESINQMYYFILPHMLLRD